MKFNYQHEMTLRNFAEEKKTKTKRKFNKLLYFVGGK